MPANMLQNFPQLTGRSPTSFPVCPFMAKRKSFPCHLVLSIVIVASFIDAATILPEPGMESRDFAASHPSAARSRKSRIDESFEFYIEKS